eukprot:CAMPEP_0201281486 /NCGR_PEP_ID=MMETSP1317-20130820/2897_1 /ASSEMBLY_ACC=CAM_ASM_000770 /TAXON_ID=187299 /ORGANISM="Undescribed Undescribed, Strain Undescribed" /LENGTH=77 /DNA_ID=CAMNT_0047591361 /DNA_START=612 /DNA_END=848 /DNA_ORIENTATION=+
MVFRASRGNALSIFRNINRPMDEYTTGRKVLRDVFILFFKAGDASALRNKLERICDSFNARKYQVERDSIRGVGVAT